MTKLEEARAYFQNDHFATENGAVIDELGDDYAICSLTLTDRHRNALGNVMGGVCVTLYGFIAVSGLKMIQQVDLGQNKNLFVVAIILICGIGGLTVSFGKVTLTAVACALILGIVANLLLKNAKEDAE